LTQPSKHPRTETSYEKFRSSFGRGLSWAYSHSLSKLNHIEESFLTRWLIGGQTKAGDTEMAARWMSLRQRPIFTWAVPGKTHRSTMSKIIKTRAHLMAARLQISEHDNFTAKFLMREGNCREDLGEHWKDEGVSQESSAAFSRAIASSSHVLRTIKSGAGKKRMNAHYARPFTRICQPSLNA